MGTSKSKSKSAPALLAAPPALVEQADAFGAFALSQLAASAPVAEVVAEVVAPEAVAPVVAPVAPEVAAPAPVAPVAPVAPAKNVPTIVVKETCNGITKPAGDTLCGQVWAKCAEITSAQGTPATPAQVLIALPAINSHTVKTQHARWRAFSGLVGRTVREVPNVPSNVVELAKSALLAAGFDKAVDIGGLSACKSPTDLVAWLALRAPVAPVADAE